MKRSAPIQFLLLAPLPWRMPRKQGLLLYGGEARCPLHGAEGAVDLGRRGIRQHI